MKLILVILALFLVIVIIIPFILNIAGVNVLQFGSISGVGIGAGLLRSLDRGVTWNNVSISENKRVSFPSQILSVAFHPRNADTIYLGTQGSGLWKSTTGGASWAPVDDKSNVLSPRADIYRVAVSTSSPDTMYVAVFQNNLGRLLRSDDGGQNFRQVYFVTANKFAVFDVNVSPTDPEHVTIVTGQGGILESQNGGATWHVIKWFTGALTGLFIDPNNPSNIYVVTANGLLYRTVDHGDNWIEVGVDVEHQTKASPYLPEQNYYHPFFSLSRQTVETIFFDPTNFNKIYIGSSQGLLRSLDGGFTWQTLPVLIPPEALPVTAIAINPQAPNIIYAAASNQLHQSSDGGVNWRVETLSVKNRIKMLLIHPLNPDRMFLVVGN